MAVILSDLRLASFNCNGLSNGRPIIFDLLQSHDICLIQEHWLFSDHLKQLNSINSDFLSVGVSGMESSVPLQRRPYGGCAILLGKSLIGSISLVSTNSKQFCAIGLSDQSGYILLIIYPLTMVLHPHMMSFSLFLMSLKVLYNQNPLTVS